MAASSNTKPGLMAMVLSLALALALVSCAARAKSATATQPAAKPVAPATSGPPQPLSTPQTQVELPKPQLVDPAALATETVPAPPVEAPPSPRPATPAPRKNPPRTETTPPAPPPVTTPTEPERQPVQDVVPAADLKRFQDSAQNRKREVARIMDVLKSRRMSRAQQNVLSSIRRFVALSDEAEKRSDMRQADVLAERAQILARDLQNGK